MPASREKIITKLSERRQIEAALRQMLNAGTEQQLLTQAQAIASLDLPMRRQVIPTIVGMLDRADSRLVVALGTLARLLDREAVVEALRWAVLQPQRTDQGRWAGLTILERFLGELPDGELASGADVERRAVSGLSRVLLQAENNPVVLVESVQGLDRQEPDVALAVVRELLRLEGMQRIELLRMLAQDVREEIAAEALNGLGSLRTAEAARALQMLIPVCSPALRPTAKRLVLKSQFAGTRVRPLPAASPEWRALVGAVDGLGQRSLWFLQYNRGETHARFLNVLLTDRAGAIEAVGHEQALVQWLPPRRSLGHLHDIALPDGSGAMLMLEAPFDFGRRLIVEALAQNRATQIPVAGVLRLLSPWLWGSESAEMAAKALPELGDGGPALVQASARLLAHPAFATWTVRSELPLSSTDGALRSPVRDWDAWARRLASQWFAEPGVAQLLSRRLEAMSEWLLMAGDEPQSRLALASAQAVMQGDPQDVPFVRALIRRELELAWDRAVPGIEDRTESN